MINPMSEPNDNYDVASSDKDYRSLSGFAVVATLLGLLSAVALASPVFWVTPLFTIVVGVAALRFLANNPDKAGRRGVVFSIALSIFFGIWAPTQYHARQWWLFREARKKADTWLELVCTKQLRKAHQLHLPPIRRLDKGKSIDEFYDKTARAQSGVYTLFEAEPLKTLIAQEEDPTFDFVRNNEYVHTGVSDVMGIEYVVNFDESGESITENVVVLVECNVNRKTRRHEWRVLRADKDKFLDL